MTITNKAVAPKAIRRKVMGLIGPLASLRDRASELGPVFDGVVLGLHMLKADTFVAVAIQNNLPTIICPDGHAIKAGGEC